MPCLYKQNDIHVNLSAQINTRHNLNSNEKKILLRVSKKCNEEKCRKKKLFGLVLFEDKFINLFTHPPFLSSCFLSFSLFFVFMNLSFSVFLVSHLLSFLLLSLSVAVLLFYSTFASYEILWSAWLCWANHLLCGKVKEEILPLL